MNGLKSNPKPVTERDRRYPLRQDARQLHDGRGATQEIRRNEELWPLAVARSGFARRNGSRCVCKAWEGELYET